MTPSIDRKRTRTMKQKYVEDCAGLKAELVEIQERLQALEAGLADDARSQRARSRGLPPRGLLMLLAVLVCSGALYASGGGRVLQDAVDALVISEDGDVMVAKNLAVGPHPDEESVALLLQEVESIVI